MLGAGGRLLYRFDADEAPSTYITNYIITAVCVAGLVFFRLKPPTPQAAAPSSAAVARASPTLLLEVHLWIFALIMLIGGLGHHVWYHNRCPGIEMPANVTVPCPEGGTNNAPVIATYLAFLGPSEFQLLPLAVAVSGLADRCAGVYLPLVVVAQLIGLCLGAVGAVLNHNGFLILGATLLVLYLAVAIACIVGLCVEKGHLVTGRILLMIGSLLAVVGGVLQVLFTPGCGSEAYLKDGAADCPFGGNGISGVNHNFVYHIFEILSKLALVAAMRFLVVDDTVDAPTKQRDVQESAVQLT